DVGWRAHPDYRGEQSLNLIANAAFIGIDHPGRAYLALAASYRHIAGDDDVGPLLRSLVSPRLLDRARILGAAMRVAYIVSAAMPGVLPRAPMTCQRGKVVLTLPPDLAALNSERLQNRLRQFSKLIGADPEIQPLAA
ncbi:MAG TPA: exopolyphosphatase, partial [Roseiarcus sp.]|nr:exopolyphosphatase [Roseiarcus sp.]